LAPGIRIEIARRAGVLLVKASMSSANAVDALVVATALEFDTSVIATGDAKDLKRLSAPYREVTVMQLCSEADARRWLTVAEAAGCAAAWLLLRWADITWSADV